MSSLTCTEYSEKAIVVRGDTKDYKEELKQLGGKYNANLRDGAGWIFSKKSQDKVNEFISQKTAVKTSSKPSVKGSTTVSKSAKDMQELLSEIAMKNMDAEECLDFIANVTRLASRSKISAIVRKLPIKDDNEQDDDDEQYYSQEEDDKPKMTRMLSNK